MKNGISNAKKYIYTSFIIGGILLILYYLLLKVMFGFVAFSNMFCILGIIILIYGYVELKFQIDFWGRIPKGLRGIIKLLFWIGLVIFITVESVIIYNGNHYDTEKPDYLIVLGAGLRGNSLRFS